MRQRYVPIFVVAGLLLGMGGLTIGQDQPKAPSHAEVEAAIKAVMSENMKKSEEEDLDGVMKTIHSKSPLFVPTRQQLSQIFSIKYLATDGDFAFARIVQRTTAGRPGFRDNELDMLAALKQEDGKWRFWNQLILELKFLDGQ